MAKPTLSEAQVDEVLRSFASNLEGDLPSPGLLKSLAKASGVMENAPLHRFKQLYNEAHGTDDDDPYLPDPGFMA